MAKRKKKNTGKTSAGASGPVGSTWPTIRQALLKLKIPAGVVVGCASLYFTYTLTGAEDLRTKVYQPLYAELSKAELLITGGSSESFIGNVMNNLSRDGELERLPKGVRSDIVSVYSELSKMRSDLGAVTELVQRTMSKQIMEIRTADSDSVWHVAASRRLRTASEAQPGIAAVATFQFKHASRGRAIDVRDPNRPIVGGPGGPIWDMSDWVGYPGTVAEMEKLWGEDDYLYFDAVVDQWYYRITRADLQRKHTDLKAFLHSAHETLANMAEFQRTVENRGRLSARTTALMAEITQRIRQPKRITDLLSW